MKYLNLVLFSIISITTIGCAPEPNSEMTVEDARQAIEQVHGRYIDAVVAEDVETFLDTVTDDFVLMPPHEPSARGKGAVRAWFNATFAAYSTVKLVFPTAEITIDRDWAFKHYTFDWTLDPISTIGRTTGRGKLPTISGTATSLSPEVTKAMPVRVWLRKNERAFVTTLTQNSAQSRFWRSTCNLEAVLTTTEKSWTGGN